ncbi:hypothetical protein BD414DRAFT_93059 [Trametes punicea]|nr:hypothetical protein BD414DRAFT_93059 [Trametes punicea]
MLLRVWRIVQDASPIRYPHVMYPMEFLTMVCSRHLMISPNRLASQLRIGILASVAAATSVTAIAFTRMHDPTRSLVHVAIIIICLAHPSSMLSLYPAASKMAFRLGSRVAILLGPASDIMARLQNGRLSP